MTTPRTIVDVSRWAPDRPETMGSKIKEWLRDPEGTRWLWKQPRPGTGEHWAEVVVAGLADLLHLPHATARLANWDDEQGVILKDVLTDHGPHAALIHGNEVLRALDPAYPKKSKLFVKPEHTVERVMETLAISTVFDPPVGMHDQEPLATAADHFLGYLLLDAWVNNADRHDENWAVLADTVIRKLSLSPTYDHGSSLGRELTDDTRTRRLRTRDAGFSVAAFCRKCTNRFATPPGEPRHSPVSAFRTASRLRPAAGAAWLQRLNKLSDDRVAAVIVGVEGEVMPDVCKDFALAMVRHQQQMSLSGSPA